MEEKRFTFVEVIIELTAYLEDCESNLTRPKRREYTNGDETIYCDWHGTIIFDYDEFHANSREWQLLRR